jgi:TonB family protein
MSKILKISKHQLNLAKVQLTGPSLLIGRSPTCDQVLRAPGIKPVHFLLEWVGEGEFNPSKGIWTLFDMGAITSGKNQLAAEGIVIDKQQQYLGLNWSIVDDRFNPAQIQKGLITNQLVESVNKKGTEEGTKLALEVIELDQSEEKVLDVWHFFNKHKDVVKHSKELPFHFVWDSSNQVKIKFTLQPSSVHNIRGQQQNLNQPLILYPQETYVVHFAEGSYFIRFINQVEHVANEYNFFQDKFWIGSIVFLIVFCFMLFGIKKSYHYQEKAIVLNPKRIVSVVVNETPKVEIPKIEEKIQKIEPVKIEPVKIEPVKVEKAEERIPVIVKAVAPPKDVVLEKNTKVTKMIPPPEKMVINAPIEKKQSAAAAPTYKSEPGKVTAGLNNPGRVSDVNAVGLLGKFKNMGSQTQNKQISADAITQTFAQNTASGNDNKGILIPTSEMGKIGVPNKDLAANGSSEGNNLMEAQTTLKGAKEFNAGNSGPMAHSQGLKGINTIGSGLGDKASSGLGSVNGVKNGSKSSNAGANDSGDITGGLTKAQVYEVIKAHQREIKTCFESALLIRNDLSGILRLSFGINAAGNVTEVKVVNSEIESSILESCVGQVIRQMVFPASPNQLPTKVVYPFNFKRSS